MSGVKGHVMMKAVTVSFIYFGGFCSDVYFLDNTSPVFQSRIPKPQGGVDSLLREGIKHLSSIYNDFISSFYNLFQWNFITYGMCLYDFICMYFI